MINIEQLTDEQQLVLAEFMFAEATDTLIKSEGEQAIIVFQEHSIAEAFTTNLDIDEVCELIAKNISDETLETIMANYTSGKL